MSFYFLDECKYDVDLFELQLSVEVQINLLHLVSNLETAMTNRRPNCNMQLGGP